MAAGARDLRQLAVTGAMQFALQFSEAREYVAGVARLVAIPRAPNWLVGLFSADGLATPLVDIEAWATGRSDARLRAPARLSALRLDDGVNSWAIRLVQAPNVLDVADARREPAGLSLPLALSARYAKLMDHAIEVLHLQAGDTALRIDWPGLSARLRQELSGLDIKEQVIR